MTLPHQNHLTSRKELSWCRVTAAAQADNKVLPVCVFSSDLLVPAKAARDDLIEYGRTMCYLRRTQYHSKQFFSSELAEGCSEVAFCGAILWL
jgi:hypothetical protein